MQRLLKISFDQALLSLTPILSWFLLSILVDKNLINVFTIIYPLQCIYSIIRSPLAVGANISKIRDKNKDAVMSGMVLGIIASIICYGYAIINIDSYISFMNVDPTHYRAFSIYAIVILLLQTIFSFILDKLYYEHNNNRANRYTIAFNLLNFSVVIGMALISKNQTVIVGVSLIIMTLFTGYIVMRNVDKFHFHLNLINCIRYDSSSLAGNILGFFTYLFGLSSAMEFGENYGLAITFASLITDTQWDALDAATTLAKIDISQRHFNYKKSLRNAYAFILLIYATSALMFIGLFHLYDLDFGLTLIFWGVELLDFALCPVYYLRSSFLQLNWSASKMTANRIVARSARLLASFLPTPFCNSIGQLFSTLFQVFTTKYYLHKYFILDKNGRLSKRRTPHKLTTGYAYDDITIDK